MGLKMGGYICDKCRIIIIPLQKITSELMRLVKNFDVTICCKECEITDDTLNGGQEDLEKIMALLQKFWDEHNNGKAVVWLKNDETGQLCIYTKGEYSKELIDFISLL